LKEFFAQDAEPKNGPIPVTGHQLQQVYDKIPESNTKANARLHKKPTIVCSSYRCYSRRRKVRKNMMCTLKSKEKERASHTQRNTTRNESEHLGRFLADPVQVIFWLHFWVPTV